MIFTNLIQTNLRTKIFGKDIEYYQRLESTNIESWELIEEGNASHGMIVITDDQYKGKGRNNNSWFMSPSKGLAMSIILTEPLSIDEAELIPIAAGVAAAKTLENRGAVPHLKWPNDILIGDKKCGGILCESKVAHNMVKNMVVGIGLNINENENDFPSDIVESATSLSMETGYSTQRELVCAIITTFFEQQINDLGSSIGLWEHYCSHLNDKVAFSYNKSNHNGIFKGINDKGHALIDIDNNLKTFPSIILE